MAYKRKTRDYYDLEGYYKVHGWEVLTSALTKKEIRSLKTDYAKNQPETPTRIRKRREKIEN